MAPTASGKSELALNICEHVQGEVVTADSMQVYKGLDIGTAKPTIEEQHRIPHHLIDVLDISEPLDVYRYVALAEQALKDIQGRGRIPVLAGGTGMYIRALLYGLDPLPADLELRRELDRLYDHKDGFEKLKERMEKEDPVDFEKWREHPRKLIRALEVFILTGKPITELQKIWKANQKLRFPAKVFYLKWDRRVLRERIEARTTVMLDEGWIEETRRMIERGLLESPTAHQALGYKLIARYISGELSRETLETLIATATWQLARRQITWFEKQHPEATTVDMPMSYDTFLDQFMG